MSKKNKPREVELKEIKKDIEYELWESKYLIGRITKNSDKYDYVLNGTDSLKSSKDLDKAINELILQYNLHNH
ncbi:hypothetical protein RD055328_07970 [Companilactobacillus sp. RD055328]|uniref:DUF2969 family protein n=1 Tax=Companilactobacillus sp. RD055328 TaxID=2916634 RepID=UPI001FC81ABE|nr:DUF2969 family protein [Companilactobacillus sp. RD055328]GKQ42874.1 hypothetical protein RD055328_07970 [Companilactobacillus sp. RD055328]